MKHQLKNEEDIIPIAWRSCAFKLKAHVSMTEYKLDLLFLSYSEKHETKEPNKPLALTQGSS